MSVWMGAVTLADERGFVVLAVLGILLWAVALIWPPRM